MRVVRAGEGRLRTEEGKAYAGLAVPSTGAQELVVARVRKEPTAANAAHSHDREEVVVVLGGRGRADIAGQMVELETGDTLIMPAGRWRFPTGCRRSGPRLPARTDGHVGGETRCGATPPPGAAHRAPGLLGCPSIAPGTWRGWFGSAGRRWKGRAGRRGCMPRGEGGSPLRSRVAARRPRRGRSRSRIGAGTGTGRRSVTLEAAGSLLAGLGRAGSRRGPSSCRAVSAPSRPGSPAPLRVALPRGRPRHG